MSRVSLNKSQYSQYGSRRVRKISTVRFENSSLFGNMRAFKHFLSSFLGDLIRLEFQGTISFRFSLQFLRTCSETTRDLALINVIYTFVAVSDKRETPYTHLYISSAQPCITAYLCAQFAPVANVTPPSRKQGRKQYSCQVSFALTLGGARFTNSNDSRSADSADLPFG